MPQPTPQKLRPVAGGYEVRLRYGASRRGRFIIVGAPHEAGALARAGELARVAALLSSAEKGEHGKDLLEKAAGEPDARAFREKVRWIEAFAAGKKAYAPAVPKGATTFQQLAERWTSGELARDHKDHVKVKADVENDVYRFEGFLYKRIGSIPLVAFKLDDAERAMRELPEGLSVASRRHYAQLISRVLSLAVYPARIITASPIPRGWLPKLGPRKAKGYLYPEEDAKLLECVGSDEEPGVPLAYRVLYGFQAREGMRSGEAKALTFEDIDLAHGTVNLDENKTNDPRTWVLDPGVVRALKIWKDHFRKDAKSSDPVFLREEIDEEKLAMRLREHLITAKVTRQELFKSTKTRLRLTVHDLRGTFVTLALASGKTERWVKDRTGHTSDTMVETYRRAARTAEELRLGWLAPLDQAIPEFRKVGQNVGQTESRGRAARKAYPKKASRSKLVHEEGVEPSRFYPPEPKSGASASSATRAGDLVSFPAQFQLLGDLGKFGDRLIQGEHIPCSELCNSPRSPVLTSASSAPTPRR